jgi:hypothetical protein
MSTSKEPRAVFGTTKKNISGVLIRAQAMHDSIVANAATFGSTPITMVAFLALVTSLAAAQAAVTGTKAKGTAEARDSKRNTLWTAMLSLQAFIQGLANVLSHDDAAALIKAAGMVVAKPKANRDKPVLAATLTSVPGNVHLEANRAALVGKADARKHATFAWQWSADGGRSWTSAPSTPYAEADITGLPLMATYSFRVSVTVAKTTGAWSQAVSILVH